MMALRCSSKNAHKDAKQSGLKVSDTMVLENSADGGNDRGSRICRLQTLDDALWITQKT